MAEWLGFGPAGASQFAGRRFRNTPDFNKWLNGIKSKSPNLEDIVQLNDDERAKVTAQLQEVKHKIYY